jgi:hypothetical protein
LILVGFFKKLDFFGFKNVQIMFLKPQIDQLGPSSLRKEGKNPSDFLGKIANFMEPQILWCTMIYNDANAKIKVKYWFWNVFLVLIAAFCGKWVKFAPKMAIFVAFYSFFQFDEFLTAPFFLRGSWFFLFKKLRK